jgi:hypothetical protein
MFAYKSTVATVIFTSLSAAGTRPGPGRPRQEVSEGAGGRKPRQHQRAHLLTLRALHS